MELEGGLLVASLVVVGMTLVIACAKTHGRQVRLRREVEGVFAVDFRADNGPVVEAIWQRDRVGFWTTFVVLVGAGAAWAWLVATGVLPEPGPRWGAFVFFAVLAVWAFAATFVVMALWWWLDLARSGKEVPAGAHAGTLGWLALDFALFAAHAALLWS